MKMSRFNIQEPPRTQFHYSTEFSRYSFPHPITFSPGAAVAVTARLVWVGLTRQSVRVRLSRLAFLPLELSTNTGDRENLTELN